MKPCFGRKEQRRLWIWIELPLSSAPPHPTRKHTITDETDSKAMSSPAADWDTLGDADAFYRKTTLYANSWAVPAGDLADYVIASARNGGPVALTRDDSKPVLLNDSGANPGGVKKKRVWVYSAAGTLLQSITVNIYLSGSWFARLS